MRLFAQSTIDSRAGQGLPPRTRCALPESGSMRRERNSLIDAISRSNSATRRMSLPSRARPRHSAQNKLQRNCRENGGYTSCRGCPFLRFYCPNRPSAVGQPQPFGCGWRKVRTGSNPRIDRGRQAFEFDYYDRRRGPMVTQIERLLIDPCCSSVATSSTASSPLSAPRAVDGRRNRRFFDLFAELTGSSGFNSSARRRAHYSSSAAPSGTSRGAPCAASPGMEVVGNANGPSAILSLRAATAHGE